MCELATPQTPQRKRSRSRPPNPGLCTWPLSTHTSSQHRQSLKPQPRPSHTCLCTWPIFTGTAASASESTSCSSPHTARPYPDATASSGAKSVASPAAAAAFFTLSAPFRTLIATGMVACGAAAGGCGGGVGCSPEVPLPLPLPLPRDLGLLPAPLLPLF